MKNRPRYKKPVYPKKLTLLPWNEWPERHKEDKSFLLQVWISRKYLVQIFDENKQIVGMRRLSVNYLRYNSRGWKDGMTWDELMQVKRDVGCGDHYAIEVYPCDRDIVNDANIRHLWLLTQPLPIGWFLK